MTHPNLMENFEAQRASIVAAINDEPESEPLDMLHAWVLRDPSFRTVARMARVEGRCVIELKGRLGLYRSETQLTFGSAIRTALMIAVMEGDK